MVESDPSPDGRPGGTCRGLFAIGIATDHGCESSPEGDDEAGYANPGDAGMPGRNLFLPILQQDRS